MSYGSSEPTKLATMIKTASQPTAMNSLAIKPCSKKSSMRYHILPNLPVRSDVAGARDMGMQAALLDRGGWHEPVEGCPKISGLVEIIELLESETSPSP